MHRSSFITHASQFNPVKGLFQCGLTTVQRLTIKLEQTRALKPDVVLMDIQLPNCNGIGATSPIKVEFPETKVVILTVSEDDDAIKYGASGYF